MGQEEELLRIAKKLEKMVAKKNTTTQWSERGLRQNPPASVLTLWHPQEGALDLLKKLNSCQMSIQLLQTTRIGVAVNGVRKHSSDKEVVSLAKVLIKNWKQLLDSPGSSKGDKGEERKKAKKKEKGLDCSNCKPEAGPSPPRKKRGEEPKDRRDSVDSKSSATSSPKSPSMERSNSSKSKVETPKTPGSPSSPTFVPSVCLLEPCYLTGDSVRDKCVEMLSAALKTDGAQEHRHQVPEPRAQPPQQPQGPQEPWPAAESAQWDHLHRGHCQDDSRVPCPATQLWAQARTGVPVSMDHSPRG
ncbi:PREDICTED: transcription elongation factor A protein 3 isoform X6 [Hipposideros armiger]|uniref:Transcription elongation factor A protein 3 isoform X6 n=1 Tax=Hipposideros armiger TaxID=186990 RepID=A0A8B7QEM4_HIPAR|nr:PREDICTED: transcription elongation factor A protein 3 isoform X6 [Hipposideros armiger]